MSDGIVPCADSTSNISSWGVKARIAFVTAVHKASRKPFDLGTVRGYDNKRVHRKWRENWGGGYDNNMYYSREEQFFLLFPNMRFHRRKEVIIIIVWLFIAKTGCGSMCSNTFNRVGWVSTIATSTTTLSYGGP